MSIIGVYLFASINILAGVKMKINKSKTKVLICRESVQRKPKCIKISKKNIEEVRGGDKVTLIECN